MSEEHLDENKLVALRREKLGAIREKGNAFPNSFRRDHLSAECLAKYNDFTKEELEEKQVEVAIAGRVMSKRIMGKASFAKIQDMDGQIQFYIQQAGVGEAIYAGFKEDDIGDIVGLKGILFKTKTNELTLRTSSYQLLTKSLRPLPEKFHGLTNQEQRYRQRYLDLIMSEESRATFKKRIQIVSYIRNFLNKDGFLEVETPMMHVIPGGATARPFVTHHNALSMDMYLRVAPELYLKQLVVGGFEKVYEINRNFRNEGLSTRHNPEFTMVEFYQSYADYRDVMDLTENLLKGIASDVMGSMTFESDGNEYDFTQSFQRLTVKESIKVYNPDFTDEGLEDMDTLVSYAKQVGIPEIKSTWGKGKIQIEIFELTVEEKLIQPTFITAYPTEVSPLARRNDDDPTVTDRFEFFVGGRELANGFSELNDAEDQAERFKAQVAEKDAGDNEAMHYDADYIKALEYGLPPTAGEGIGIDRLVMLFTNSTSIRDVLLFPHMRLE